MVYCNTNRAVNVKKVAIALLFVLAIFTIPVAIQANTPEYIRIGLTQEFANQESIQIGNTRIVVGYCQLGNFNNLTNLQSDSGFIAHVRNGQVALYAGGVQVFSFSQPGAQIMGVGGSFIQLGRSSYRGIIEFNITGGRLTAINVICMEEYLYGVLPAEMGHYFHINALKAQAIASRTFMAYRRNEAAHSHQNFDLCDSTHCQSYRGTLREHDSTTRAIRETRGQMLFYNNSPILAVYFASSGGSTDNSENVWVQARPYLRAVRDHAEQAPVEWTREFTWAQLTTAAQNAGADIGIVNGISVIDTTQYGRVQEIRLYGTNGQWMLRGEATRTFFAPIGGTLMSRNFYIAGAGSMTPDVTVYDGQSAISGSLASFEWLDANGTIGSVYTAYVFDGTTMRPLTPTPTRATGGAGITINGRGWGHGVGMSQRGAHGMALAGFSYREILMHYYTGVEIR